jgi:sialate O-acetylesterase
MLNNRKHTLLGILFFLLLSTYSKAEIILPKIIGSNMVLQRGKPVAIWGTASVDEKITVRFGKQVKKTTANASGKWQVILDAMIASVTPTSMVIAGNNTITLENILVGEVWLCSGQSNMEYTMMKESKFANAIRSKGLDSVALKNERNNNIRLFLVKRDLTKPDGGGVNKGWNAAEGEYLRAFSAAGYFFAKKLQQELGVPVGMIASSVSGSAIEPWLPGTVLEEKGSNIIKLDESQPGKFYTGMIKPLAPFTLKGFLWYQGETNCFQNETTAYTQKFTQLINSWRKLWNDKKASFYFVQIAPHSYSKSNGKIILTEETLPRFREAQTAVLKLAHTGMVVTTDLVDKLEDIHPTYKWEIGRRLALLALTNDYQKKLIYSGPVFKKATINSSKIEIEFISTGSGLTSNDRKPLNCFMIAGANEKFIAADAIIKDNKVIVSAREVASPIHVRFAFNEAAQPNFFNKEGLPAVPFRTDHISDSLTEKGTGF